MSEGILSVDLTNDVEIKKSSAPSVGFEISSEGVWKIKKVEFSAVFPPGDEPSPFVVARCREIDPNFTVLWCRKVMLTPSLGEEVFGHYVICRFVPSWMEKANTGKRPVQIGVVPANFPFDPKRIFELESWTIKWPKGSYGARLGLPEMPKPFDEKVIAYVEAQEWIHRNVRVQDAVAALKSIFKEDEDALRKTIEDAEYQLKQEWKEMKKCVEEGRLLPPVFEPTPFVEMPKASMESE